MSESAVDWFRAYYTTPKVSVGPDIRFLQRFLDDGYSITDLEFVREPDPFYRSVPEFHFTLRKGENSQPHRLKWQQGIEPILYQRRVKARNRDQETSRGAWLLLRNLDAPDMEWGKDYVDQVLHKILRKEFGEDPGFARFLEMVPDYSPRKSKAYEACKQSILHSLGGFAYSLTHELGYDQEEATEIFAKAVLRMFDERHHLSLRSVLFPRNR